MTQARFELDDYVLRVLDIIKGKYGLKNRNEALNKFFYEFGDKYLEAKIDENYLNKLDMTIKEHEEKYGDRVMSEEELDELLDLKE